MKSSRLQAFAAHVRQLLATQTRVPPSVTMYRVGSVDVEVIRKSVKGFHLRVRGADTPVSLSVPYWTPTAMIERVVRLKAPWIRKQQERFANHPPRRPLQYVTGEVHYYRGERYTLEVVEGAKSGSVVLDSACASLRLAVRRRSSRELRRKLVEQWYRSQLEARVPLLLAKWQPEIGRSIQAIRFRQMTSRWGSCHIRDRRIVLNIELAKRHERCLEYVLVHELVHLLERSHNARFRGFMDRFYPDWRIVQAELERPLGSG